MLHLFRLFEPTFRSLEDPVVEWTGLRGIFATRHLSNLASELVGHKDG